MTQILIKRVPYLVNKQSGGQWHIIFSSNYVTWCHMLLLMNSLCWVMSKLLWYFKQHHWAGSLKMSAMYHEVIFIHEQNVVFGKQEERKLMHLRLHSYLAWTWVLGEHREQVWTGSNASQKHILIRSFEPHLAMLWDAHVTNVHVTFVVWT